MSDAWLANLNDVLAARTPTPLSGDEVTRIVLEFTDAPRDGAHELTFTVTATRATAEFGDHLGADAVLRLSYADAVALISGTLDSSQALREGRLKIRGDVHALVPLLAWLQSDPTA
ncbi:MAG: SCP2 sterol-binding domain-containing protein [Acidimicrobiales bacterium]